MFFLYEHLNTVTLLERNFTKHDLDKFHFDFQWGSSSGFQEVKLVFQKMELFGEESSRCFARRLSVSVFRPMNPFQKRSTLERKKQCLSLVEKLHLFSSWGPQVKLCILQIRHLIPAWVIVLWACIRKYSITHFLCWLLVGSEGKLIQNIRENFVLLGQLQFEADKRIFGAFCTFLKKSFVFRVTETEQKVRDYWLPSLQIEKFTLLHSRLTMYKMKHEMNFWSSVSANGESTRLCH